MGESGRGAARRTHYSSELPSCSDGQKATVMGWVSAVRGHGSIAFLTIEDMEGPMQVVLKEGACPAGMMEQAKRLKQHSSVAVTGTVAKSAKSPSGAEIVPESLTVFYAVEKLPPFEPQAKTVKNIETRLDARVIDLRRRVLQDVFRARSDALRAVRQYFYDSKFTEVSTPKLIASATEGGASLFSIFYYAKQAYLAQSPQLYKEQLVMSFEKVFEIAPIFRAESSRTSRHLAEAISIDIEEAFADYNDAMDRAEGVVKSAAGAVALYAKEHGAEFAVPQVPEKIPRHTYSDVIDMMKKSGADAEWGDDLYPSRLREAGLEGFYFITDWPLGPKPFYVKPSAGNEKMSESFDLMFGDLEVSSGSSRIDRREDLEHRLANKGMQIDSFKHHLECFEYGMPPHAGCGIGLERLIMALTGTENIRDATFYPRDVDRLTP